MLVYQPLKLGRYSAVAVVGGYTNDLTSFGPGSAYAAIDIVTDASRLVHNGSRVPKLYRLNGWLRTYKNSTRIRGGAGHVLGLRHI